jgi:hypothetical protein
MPDFLFLDRSGNELGIIASDNTAWEVGSVVERRSGQWQVVEVIVPIWDDVDGVSAYVIIEPDSV